MRIPPSTLTNFDGRGAKSAEFWSDRDLRRALGILLAAPARGHSADRETIDGFLTTLRQTDIRWSGYRCTRGGSISGMILSLILPGRTALLIPANPGDFEIDFLDQLRLTAAALDSLSRERLHYAQALAECDAAGKRELLQRAGFAELAPLTYLRRKVMYPWVEPPPPEAVTWTPYDASTHAEFARTLLATYEDSLDCRELAGVRAADDILASHRAAGRFTPRLWELARVEGEHAGCLLLARIEPHAMLEVVYMGVAARFRKRGLGALLLRRALQQARADGARDLTLVVDERNTPARRLYERFSFREVAARTAYWRRFT
jgi:GNAT superfamily N-acetyltransferase